MKNNTFNTQSEKYGVIKTVCGILLCVLLVSAFVLASVFAMNTSVCEAATDFKTVGKSAYMVDYATDTVLYARNENERLPIASMVKIMTSLLTLEAAERGDISLDDDVEISQNSANMGGSQVFLDAGTTHKAGELLKTVIVASANDSCVALAEHISGSVENFVAKMNARAKELGIESSKIKKVITTSATFSILPGLGIALGVVTLIGTLGIAFPAIRLSVVGSLQYETQMANGVAEGLYGSMSNMIAHGISAQDFATMIMIMTIAICSGGVEVLFFYRLYQPKIGKLMAKTTGGKKGGVNIGDLVFQVSFIGMVIGYLAMSIETLAKNVTFIDGYYNFIAVLVAMACMYVCDVLINKAKK